jgi:hypothetical protein
MRSPARALALLCLLALCSAAAAQEKVRNHFDSDAPMREPAFFDFYALGAPGKSRWMVMADHNPPSTPNRVMQTETQRAADAIAAAIRRGQSFRDGRVAVSIRKDTGRGGLILRFRDERDFLALLVEQASGDAVLTAWKGGKATELARGRAERAHQWGTIAVELDGAMIRARWNGAPLLEGADPETAEGRAGFAQAGPGSVSFDEFVIEPKGDR